MKKALLIIGLVTACITGAYFLSQSSDETLPSRTTQSICLVNAIDPSGTTQGKGWPMPEKDFYLKEIKFIEDNGGGCLYVFNISKPIPTPISLQILAILPEADIYESGEDEVKRIRKANIEAKNQNEKNKAEFLISLDEFILNFKPARKDDFTYVNAHITAIVKTLKLSIFQNSNRFLFVYSDLLDHTPTSKPSPLAEYLINSLNSTNSKVVLCSFVSNSATEGINSNSIPSYQDFISIINNKTY